MCCPAAVQHRSLFVTLVVFVACSICCKEACPSSSPASADTKKRGALHTSLLPETRSAAGGRQLQQQYGVENNRVMPEWGRAVLSDMCIMTRPGSEEELLAFFKYCVAVVHAYLDMSRHVQPPASNLCAQRLLSPSSPAQCPCVFFLKLQSPLNNHMYSSKVALAACACLVLCMCVPSLACLLQAHCNKAQPATSVVFAKATAQTECMAFSCSSYI